VFACPAHAGSCRDATASRTEQTSQDSGIFFSIGGRPRCHQANEQASPLGLPRRPHGTEAVAQSFPGGHSLSDCPTGPVEPTEARPLNGSLPWPRRWLASRRCRSLQRSGFVRQPQARSSSADRSEIQLSSSIRHVLRSHLARLSKGATASAMVMSSPRKRSSRLPPDRSRGASAECRSRPCHAQPQHRAAGSPRIVESGRWLIFSSAIDALASRFAGTSGRSVDSLIVVETPGGIVAPIG